METQVYRESLRRADGASRHEHNRRPATKIPGWLGPLLMTEDFF